MNWFKKLFCKCPKENIVEIGKSDLDRALESKEVYSNNLKNLLELKNYQQFTNVHDIGGKTTIVTRTFLKKKDGQVNRPRDLVLIVSLFDKFRGQDMHAAVEKYFTRAVDNHQKQILDWMIEDAKKDWNRLSKEAKDLMEEVLKPKMPKGTKENCVRASYNRNDEM